MLDKAESVNQRRGTGGRSHHADVAGGDDGRVGDTPVDFFVSHTSADRPWAEWIAGELEQAGFSTVL